MKNFFVSKLFYCVLRVLIGGMFVVAGAIKLTDPGTFAQAIDGYGLVTWRTANLLAYVLPTFEIATGLGLILDIRGALGMIVAQLLGFVGIIAYAINLGLDVDCGCFGPSDPGGGASGGLWQALIRDMLMLGVCLLMYWQRRAADFVPRSLKRLIVSGNKDTS